MTLKALSISSRPWTYADRYLPEGAARAAWLDAALPPRRHRSQSLSTP